MRNRSTLSALCASLRPAPFVWRHGLLAVALAASTPVWADGGVVLDAGASDAGAADAGLVVDAGAADGGLVADAGDADAGLALDAGAADGGLVADAGEVVDAGEVDAGHTDAGVVVDAGITPACEERCDGNTLVYCDGDIEASLVCADVDGSCAMLSAEWGLDCVLGQGDACSPGYANGRSRCAAGLTCVEDVCAPCPDGDCSSVYPEAPEVPSASGADVVIDNSNDDVFGCLNLDSLLNPVVPFAAVLFVWRRRRRRR